MLVAVLLAHVIIATLGEWMGLVIAFGTICGGIGFVARRFWVMTRHIVHFSDAVPDLLAMSKEFKPNGGGSLRDSVDRLEKGLADTNTRIEGYVATDLEAHQELRALVIQQSAAIQAKQ